MGWSVSTEERRVTIRHDDDGVVVVSGELDLFAVPALESALDASLDGQPSLVVDMSAVTFIDSSVLAILVASHQRLATDHRRLELRSPSGFVERVIELAGLTEILFGRRVND
jgi:anti-anti-sigma factor